MIRAAGINYFSLRVFCLVTRELYHNDIAGVNTYLTFNVFIPRQVRNLGIIYRYLLLNLNCCIHSIGDRRVTLKRRHYLVAYIFYYSTLVFRDSRINY